MYNFSEIIDEMKKNNAGIMVLDQKELEEKILYLKNNASERIKLANNFTKLCGKRRKKQISLLKTFLKAQMFNISKFWNKTNLLNLTLIPTSYIYYFIYLIYRILKRKKS